MNYYHDNQFRDAIMCYVQQNQHFVLSAENGTQGKPITSALWYTKNTSLQLAA